MQKVRRKYKSFYRKMPSVDRWDEATQENRVRVDDRNAGSLCLCRVSSV